MGSPKLAWRPNQCLEQQIAPTLSTFPGMEILMLQGCCYYYGKVIASTFYSSFPFLFPYPNITPIEPQYDPNGDSLEFFSQAAGAPKSVGSVGWGQDIQSLPAHQLYTPDAFTSPFQKLTTSRSSPKILRPCCGVLAASRHLRCVSHLDHAKPTLHI